jgi:hypothetical protein
MRMHRMATALTLTSAALLLAPAALAQQSANYKLTEWTINAGGDPMNGNSAASVSFKIKLDAIGDAVLGAGQASASFHADSGFVDVYAPAGEIQNQRFTNVSTMTWDAERSVGVYEVYRGTIGSLPGTYGACFQSSIGSTTASDATAPPVGAAWFYIVTAKNRIGEEGTKGYDSNSTQRANPAPCP